MNNDNLLLRSITDSSLNRWREKEKTALELLQIVGELRFDKSIELVLFQEIFMTPVQAKFYTTISIQKIIQIKKSLLILRSHWHIRLRIFPVYLLVKLILVIWR